MPSFGVFLLFMLGWFILAVFVVALLNVVKLQQGKTYYDHAVIIEYVLYDLEQTERIFSVDNIGEAISNHDNTDFFWPPLDDFCQKFGTVITVDDNEDHDMFRNNAGKTQL